jgi:hypothetical protein
LNIEYGSPWGDNSGLGVELLWNVTNVSLDGTPVSVKQIHRFAQSWSGYCEGVAAPGDHEITIDVECAYVDDINLTTMNASMLPVAQWPTAVKRWTKTIVLPVTIEPQQ